MTESTNVVPGARPGRPSRGRGQALVEFALILPLLIILLFAIIDFGYYLFVTISVNHATRAAVRKACMNNVNRDQIRAIVVNSAVGVVVSTAQVTITTVARDANLPGSPPSVEVVTEFDHRFFAPSLLRRDSLHVKSAFKGIITTYSGRSSVMF